MLFRAIWATRRRERTPNSAEKFTSNNLETHNLRNASNPLPTLLMCDNVLYHILVSQLSPAFSRLLRVPADSSVIVNVSVGVQNSNEPQRVQLPTFGDQLLLEFLIFLNIRVIRS